MGAAAFFSAKAPMAAPATDGLAGSVEAEVVRVRARADVPRIEPGATFHLAFVFEIQEKWHVYWRNPGEGAAPVEIRIEAPPGFAVGDIRWPRPVVIPGPLGDSYGYEHSAVLFVPVTAPVELGDGTAAFHADLAWAVCREVCRFGTARKSIRLPTGASSPGDPSIASPDPIVVEHARRLPLALAEVSGGAIEFDGRLLTLTGPASGRDGISFFPDRSPGVTYGPANSRIVNDRFLIEMEIDLNANNALGRPMQLGGLVAVGMKPDDPCYEFSRPVEVSLPPAAIP
jgi:thiol:disulfide interchange protein DsbD